MTIDPTVVLDLPEDPATVHARYVRAARAYGHTDEGLRGGRITGHVLHLVTYQPEGQGFGFHAPLPLCGGPGWSSDRDPVERWDLTGPWADGWAGHAHWRLCTRCTREVPRLVANLLAQVERVRAHLDGVAS